MSRDGIDFSRVLLKISGEALAGPERRGIDVARVQRLAGELGELHARGVEVAVVVGGGNIVRGQELAAIGVDRAAGDQMGMLGTVINGLALQDALGSRGVEARLASAIEVGAICEPFVRRRCMRHLAQGQVVILVGGTGNPYFTTDTAAALRAVEVGAHVLLKGTKVDGVYSADPVTDKAAVRYDRLSYREVIHRNLRVMDTTAIALCRDNGLPIIVFNVLEAGALLRVVSGEPMGTLVDAAE
ncbi:MAG: UMP kinase [Planctomycetota bacterium]